MDIASCIEARVRRQLRDQLEEQLMAAKQDDAILAEALQGLRNMGETLPPVMEEILKLIALRDSIQMDGFGEFQEAALKEVCDADPPILDAEGQITIRMQLVLLPLRDKGIELKLLTPRIINYILNALPGTTCSTDMKTLHLRMRESAKSLLSSLGCTSDDIGIGLAELSQSRGMRLLSEASPMRLSRMRLEGVLAEHPPERALEVLERGLASLRRRAAVDRQPKAARGLVKQEAPPCSSLPATGSKLPVHSNGRVHQNRLAAAAPESAAEIIDLCLEDSDEGDPDMRPTDTQKAQDVPADAMDGIKEGVPLTGTCGDKTVSALAVESPPCILKGQGGGTNQNGALEAQTAPTDSTAELQEPAGKQGQPVSVPERQKLSHTGNGNDQGHGSTAGGAVLGLGGSMLPAKPGTSAPVAVNVVKRVNIQKGNKRQLRAIRCQTESLPVQGDMAPSDPLPDSLAAQGDGRLEAAVQSLTRKRQPDGAATEPNENGKRAAIEELPGETDVAAAIAARAGLRTMKLRDLVAKLADDPYSVPSVAEVVPEPFRKANEMARCAIRKAKEAAQASRCLGKQRQGDACHGRGPGEGDANLGQQSSPYSTPRRRKLHHQQDQPSRSHTSPAMVAAAAGAVAAEETERSTVQVDPVLLALDDQAQINACRQAIKVVRQAVKDSFRRLER